MHLGSPLVICWPWRNNWTGERSLRAYGALVLPKPGSTVRPSLVEVVIPQRHPDIPCTSADALSTLLRTLPSWYTLEKFGNRGVELGGAGSVIPYTLKLDTCADHDPTESLGGAPGSGDPGSAG